MDQSLPLLRKEYITPHIVALSFDKNEYPFDFFPGQYVTITLPITPTDGNGATRDFTIASSPTEKDVLMIVTKEGITDAKKALTNLTIGEAVTFTKPQGGFYLREQITTPRILISGGIGITPFLSMIKYTIDKQLHIPVTLLASFSLSEEAIFYDKLAMISKDHPEIKIMYTISRHDATKEKTHQEIGRISQEMIEKYGGDMKNSLFMIAGSPEMVDSTQEVLIQMGIEEKNIQSEQFPGY